IATVPAKVTVPKGQTSAIANWNGVTVGESLIFATAGSITLAASPTVVDKVRVTIVYGSSAVAKGGPTTIAVGLNMYTPTAVTVMLSSSSAGGASVPASVTIPPWSQRQAVSCNAIASGRTTLTATIAGSSVSQSLIVVDKAQLSPSNTSYALEVGGVIN